MSDIESCGRHPSFRASFRSWLRATLQSLFDLFVLSNAETRDWGRFKGDDSDDTLSCLSCAPAYKVLAMLCMFCVYAVLSKKDPLVAGSHRSPREAGSCVSESVTSVMLDTGDRFEPGDSDLDLDVLVS